VFAASLPFKQPEDDSAKRIIKIVKKYDFEDFIKC